LFARNKAAFDNKYLKFERDSFFDTHSISTLKGQRYNELLFEIFKDNARPEIRFLSITVTGKNNTLEYGLYKSLKAYFAAEGINNDLSYGDRETFLFTFKGRFNFNNFVKFAEIEHNISFSLLVHRNKRDFLKSVEKHRRSELRLLRISRHYDWLKTKHRFISAILAILLFLCFALNWMSVGYTIYYSITGLFPTLDDLASRTMLIFALIIWLLYGVGALILFVFSCLFPLIAGFFLFLISEAIFKSIFRNNVVYPKAITVSCIVVILVLSAITMKEANILPPNLLTLFNRRQFINHVENNRVGATNNRSGINDSVRTKSNRALNLATISVNAANMRAGPSTRYRVVDVIRTNEQFEIVSSSNGWSRIRFKGKEGYVSNRLIRTEK